MKFLLLILISVVTCSCDKNDDLIAPPITEENTFSCKIDGELFVPEFHGGFPSPGGEAIMVNSYKNNKWVIILGNGAIDIYLHLIGIDGTGEYKILKSDTDITFLHENNIAMKLKYRGSNSKTYNSHNNTGTINVLKWNGENILVAEFEKLILYNSSNPNQTIILTEGKLNINLATLNED